ncbi:hypothetical protein JCM16814_08200 [Desulfobaculum senezii]
MSKPAQSCKIRPYADLLRSAPWLPAALVRVCLRAPARREPVFVSEAYCALLGREREEVFVGGDLGQWREVLAGPEERLRLQRAILEGEPVGTNTVVRRPDGERVLCQCLVLPAGEAWARLVVEFQTTRDGPAVEIAAPDILKMLMKTVSSQN